MFKLVHVFPHLLMETRNSGLIRGSTGRDRELWKSTLRRLPRLDTSTALSEPIHIDRDISTRIETANSSVYVDTTESVDSTDATER